MKKIYLSFLLLAFLSSKNASAKIIAISVTNYQFTPANTNVTVGDTVRFTFISGTHNATTNGVSGGLPAGAVAVYSGGIGAVSSYDYITAVTGTYKYVCELHGNAATYTGMVGQFTVSSIVPVTLTQFNIEPDGKKPLLTWATTTEQNADYFSIRSSTDDIHFTEIGRVNASGNSSDEKFYSFIDNTITSSNNFIYYELAIVDKNGNEQLSPIKLFTNPNSTTKLIEQLSPNPISRPGQLMVYFNSQKEDMLNVNVFDATGKQVLTTNMEAVQGLNSGHIHVCNFAAGIYTLVFTMNGLKETRQVVVN